VIWGAFFGAALAVRVGLKGSGDILTKKSARTMASEDSLALPLLPSDRAIVVPAKIWAPHNFVTMTQCLPPHPNRQQLDLGDV
jgi:hypothetical protein